MNGWTLLAPAGLFALAALAIPLLIHLLSRSRGQRVLVGNIELFRHIRRQRASQIRLVQWLLLALRLLMLLAAALLLAGLARQGLAPPANDTAYVTPARLAATERGEAPEIDDHDQLVSLQDGWVQLAEALATRRHDGPVPVYTLASAADQPDQPLALPSPVVWHSAGTTEPRAPASMSVVIAHDSDGDTGKRLADAQALDAALNSVADYRELVIDVRITTTGALVSQDAPPTDFTLIWLSDRPVPSGSGASVLVSESIDEPTPLQGFVTLHDWPGLNFLGSGSAADQPPRSESLWRGPQGHPLLAQKVVGGQRQLQFSRDLGLDVNGPAAQDRWPDMLARLLLGEAEWNSGTAHAAMPASQPSMASRLLTRGQPARSVVPLLALILALLFIVERWLAERPRGDVNGNEQR